MITAVLFALGVLLMAGPLYFKMHWIAVVLCEGLGVTLIGVGGYLSLFKKFFQIPGANEAIVRTGKGRKRKAKKEGIEEEAQEAPEVAIGYGLWCIPMFHKYTHFKFQQHVFPIEKKGLEALQCQDGRLADVEATGKVSVPQTSAAVLKFLAAAGERDPNKEETYRALTLPTLETSLRDAATTRTYEEVFQGREQVSSEVESSVEDDFSQIGVQLDTMKLQGVEPTPKDFYQETNPQHAVGLTAITVITQEQRLATITKTLETDQLVKNQEVDTRKKILGLEQAQQFAEADQQKEVRSYQALQSKEASVAEIQTEEDIAARGIAKDLALEKQRVLKDQQVQEANVASEQAVDLAGRDKEIAVAKKEQQRAQAEQERLAAEKAREIEAQALETVKVVQTAERLKQEAVIGKQADVEKTKIEKQMDADVEAYKVTVHAEAEKTAAENHAAAVTTKAEADKKAAEFQAEGDKAVQMVPVDVASRQVEVDASRVKDVLQPELKAKADNQQISVELEVQRLRIEAEKEIGVALAEALGIALSNAKMTIWGDPSTVARITQSFVKGQVGGQFVHGLLEATPDKVTQVAEDLVGAAASGIKGLAEMGAVAIKNATGKDIDPDALLKAINKVVADPKAVAKAAEAAPEEA